MQISELPRLKSLLDLMGLDNGANVTGTAAIPAQWELCALLAENELLHLSAEQAVTLAMGEQTEQQDVARRAPNADAILVAAFDDGELADVFYEPWQNIFDAMEAEQRVRNLADADGQSAGDGK